MGVAGRATSRTPHKFLAIDGFANAVLLRRVVEDRLIDQKVTIAHTGYWLHEVKRVVLEVVGRLFDLGASHTIAWPSRYIKLLIHSCYINVDQFLNILRILQLLVVKVATLFELGQNSLASQERSTTLLLIETVNGAHLRG